MDRDKVRLWVAGHQRAGQRSLEQLRAEGPMSPEESLAAALELMALAPANDEADPVREREVSDARRAWAKLRAWAAKRA